MKTASKSLIILSLLLLCSVLVSSRHLEESIHKAEEKGAEQVKDDPRGHVGYGALVPGRPLVPRSGLPHSRGCWPTNALMDHGRSKES